MQRARVGKTQKENADVLVVIARWEDLARLSFSVFSFFLYLLRWRRK